ncbi:MAG: hypothetical protein ACRCX8_05035 [Sarcina sp.]
MNSMSIFGTVLSICLSIFMIAITIKGVAGMFPSKDRKIEKNTEKEI